jgi:predicted permease
MSSVVADLKFAVRMMTRGPGITAILVLTLALGIAASTAIFSVVNSVLLKPLPYEKPEQLVRVYTEFLGKMQLRKFAVSVPEYFNLARDCKTCESVAAWGNGTASLSGGDRPVRVDAAYTTHGLLPMLGVKPMLGRFFTAEEDRPGDPTVVVLGYGVWKRAFGGDPSVVGKAIRLDAMPVTIIGVMPPGFDFLGRMEAWVPACLDPNSNRVGSHWLRVLARLAPGASPKAFETEVQGLEAQWKQKKNPFDHYIDHETHPVIAVPLQADIVGGISTALWLLQAAALFVLLIAVVNVANLLLARSETRNREIAVRHALGARRRRLIRQFLTESLVVGGIGGALGVLAAVWALDGIVALIPPEAPRVGEIGLDGSAVLFAVACTVGASILFGLAPILHARRTDIHSALKDGSPRTTGSKTRLRVRRALVITEVALAVVLVVGCGVMVKSFLRLQEVDLGIDPERVLTAEIELPTKNYPDGAARVGFWHRLQDRIAGLPGVDSVSLLGALPLQRGLNANDIGFPGRTPPDKADTTQPVWNVDFWQTVGDDAMAALGARLVAGRSFGPTDTATAPGVVLVNQAFANRFWPGENPIGQRVSLNAYNADGSPNTTNVQTVIGVVADMRQMGLDRPAGTEVFIPITQAEAQAGGAPITMSLIIRSKGDPGALAPSVQAAVGALDPSLPVSKLRTMNDVVWEAVARPRFLTMLLTAFAAMALLLAAVGIYGVMAHTVAQRTHEIGVRVALGAQPAHVRAMVLRQAAVLVIGGVGIGVVAAIGLQLWLGASLRGVLYGGSIGNPIMLGGVAVAVTLAAMLATWVPARRATRVEPTVALRTE